MYDVVILEWLLKVIMLSMFSKYSFMIDPLTLVVLCTVYISLYCICVSLIKMYNSVRVFIENPDTKDETMVGHP